MKALPLRPRSRARLVTQVSDPYSKEDSGKNPREFTRELLAKLWSIGLAPFRGEWFRRSGIAAEHL
jgi:hypothetical protein